MAWLTFVALANGPLVFRSVQVIRLVEAWRRYELGGAAVNESRTLVEVLVMFSTRVANATEPYSNAPMSAPSPNGRMYPRWSVLGTPALSPKSIAGLMGSKAMPQVGPP